MLNRKIIGIFVMTLLIATGLPSISGKTVEHEVGMKEPTEIYETTYNDILFSDDFNDNIIDHNKWTEIYTSGTWEETNGRAEFQLTESGGTGTRSEGIESSPFEGLVGGDEPWDNKLTVIWKMFPDIGSTSSEGEITLRITNGRNWIQMGYDRLTGAACYSDSMGNNGEFVGGDEPWDNKLEIYLPEYHVTMNSNSATVHDSIFSSGTSTFNIQIYIELDGSSRMLYLRSGFDDILVEADGGGGVPNAPLITGSTNGKAGVEYSYSLVSADPQGDDVSYYVEWGDGSNSGWIGPSTSGVEVTETHTWTTQGTYTIQAKAKDTNGLEGDWGTLRVSIPKNKEINSPLLRFLENHPHLFPLLRQLLGLEV